MAKQDYNQIAGQKISRIEALSDGLFAIAMTLLILGIVIPSAEGIDSEAKLIDEFLKLAPKFLSYLLGFMTLGIFWVGHSTQFKFIDKTDRHLTWLTIFFWMVVSIIPFSTSFLSSFINFKFAIGLYWLNIFLCGVTLYFHWGYAEKNNLLDETLDGQTIGKAVRNRIIQAQIFYAVAALACFLNNYLSVCLFILIQLNYALAVFFSSEKSQEKR
ncbi:MAG TPA: TMEM175 family protein [Pyrinomonadaceae bacterium]|nr:TMEM175 family protein [Pyrinomonadaceae bacterium]